jgi:multidrug efflux pump subunit AcrB
LFREFAVTVSVAVVASAFVALTLTPMMCSRFLSHESETTQPGRLSRMAEGFFNAMLHGYDRGLRWVFRHQPLMLASTLGLIVLTGYLYVTIPKGFIPQQVTGFIFGALQARLDASFNTVSKLENAVSAVIPKDPAVFGVVGFAGAAGSNPSESTARMFIQLKSFNERDGVDTVIKRLKPQIAKLQGVKIFMQSGQDVTVGGRLA